MNTLHKREVAVLLPPDTMKQEMLKIPNITCDVKTKDMILTKHTGQRLKDRQGLSQRDPGNPRALPGLLCWPLPRLRLPIPVTRVSYNRRGGWVDLILTKLSSAASAQQNFCYVSSLV